ncbi:hypothetical protein FOZ62_024536, partial [Perkinsus olseni]
MDILSAFYALRLSNCILQLATSDTNFATIRSAFGVCFGPEGLSITLGTLVDRVRTCPALVACLLALFVDDITIQSDIVTIFTAARLLLGLLLPFSFRVQPRKFKCLVARRLREAFAEEARRSHIDVPLADSASLLGYHFHFTDDDRLVMDCARTGRLASAKALISTVPHGDWLSLNLSKRQYFQLCGDVGYDNVKLHAEERASADALRALIGSAFVATPWSAHCDLHDLLPDQKKAFIVIMKWMSTFLDAGPCHHGSPTRFSPAEDITLNLTSDASLNGGAFSITCSSTSATPYVIWEDCWRFKSAQRRWHSNCRELLSLLRGLRALTDLLEARAKQVSPGDQSKWRICVECDNKPSVLWSTGSTQSIRRALERRTIERMVTAVADEIAFARSQPNVQFSLSHLPGRENTRSDYLSRLHDRSCGSSTLGEILCRPSAKASPISAVAAQQEPSPQEDQDAVALLSELDEGGTLGRLRESVQIPRYVADSVEVGASISTIISSMESALRIRETRRSPSP